MSEEEHNNFENFHPAAIHQSSFSDGEQSESIEPLSQDILLDASTLTPRLHRKKVVKLKRGRNTESTRSLTDPALNNIIVNGSASCDSSPSFSDWNSKLPPKGLPPRARSPRPPTGKSMKSSSADMVLGDNAVTSTAPKTSSLKQKVAAKISNSSIGSNSFLKANALTPNMGLKNSLSNTNVNCSTENLNQIDCKKQTNDNLNSSLLSKLSTEVKKRNLSLDRRKLRLSSISSCLDHRFDLEDNKPNHSPSSTSMTVNLKSPSDFFNSFTKRKSFKDGLISPDFTKNKHMFGSMHSTLSSKKQLALLKKFQAPSEFFTLKYGPEDEGELIAAFFGQKLEQAIFNSITKHGLTLDQVEVYLDSSKTPLPLSSDIFLLANSVLMIKVKEYSPPKTPVHQTTSMVEQRKRIGSLTRQPKKSMSSMEDVRVTDSTASDSMKSKPKSKLHSLFGSFTKVQMDKQDQLTEILNSYSQNGFPKMPDLLTLGRPNYDRGVFKLESHWTQLISANHQLSKYEQDQQEAIWELLVTEVDYINKLRVITDLFVCCLINLQNDLILNEIEVDKLCSNLVDVFYATCHFWVTYLNPVVMDTRQTGNPMDPSKLKPGFLLFDKIFEPYKKYCLEQEVCRKYTKNRLKDNELFKTFINWAESQPQCKRLKLTDLIVTPFQRLTKYKLLLAAINKPVLRLVNASDDNVKTEANSIADDIVNACGDKSSNKIKENGVVTGNHGDGGVANDNNCNDLLEQIINECKEFNDKQKQNDEHNHVLSGVKEDDDNEDDVGNGDDVGNVVDVVKDGDGGKPHLIVEGLRVNDENEEEDDNHDDGVIVTCNNIALSTENILNEEDEDADDRRSHVTFDDGDSGGDDIVNRYQPSSMTTTTTTMTTTTTTTTTTLDKYLKQKKNLKIMMDHVDRFVSEVNRAVRQSQEHQQLSVVMESIDCYEVVDVISEECQKLIERHSHLDLTLSIPGCHPQEKRSVILQGPLKIKETSGKTDVHCYLLTDMFLIMKQSTKKLEKVKYKVIRPATPLDRIVVYELKDNVSFLMVILNEFNLVQSVVQLVGEVRLWMDAISRAQKEYEMKKLSFRQLKLNQSALDSSRHDDGTQVTCDKNISKSINSGMFDSSPQSYFSFDADSISIFPITKATATMTSSIDTTNTTLSKMTSITTTSKMQSSDASLFNSKVYPAAKVTTSAAKTTASTLTISTTSTTSTTTTNPTISTTTQSNINRRFYPAVKPITLINVSTTTTSTTATTTSTTTATATTIGAVTATTYVMKNINVGLHHNNNCNTFNNSRYYGSKQTNVKQSNNNNIKPGTDDNQQSNNDNKPSNNNNIDYIINNADGNSVTVRRLVNNQKRPIKKEFDDDYHDYENLSNINNNDNNDFNNNNNNNKGNDINENNNNNKYFSNSISIECATTIDIVDNSINDKTQNDILTTTTATITATTTTATTNNIEHLYILDVNSFNNDILQPLNLIDQEIYSSTSSLNLSSNNYFKNSNNNLNNNNIDDNISSNRAIKKCLSNSLPNCLET